MKVFNERQVSEILESSNESFKGEDLSILMEQLRIATAILQLCEPNEDDNLIREHYGDWAKKIEIHMFKILNNPRPKRKRHLYLAR